MLEKMFILFYILKEFNMQIRHLENDYDIDFKALHGYKTKKPLRRRVTSVELLMNYKNQILYKQKRYWTFVPLPCLAILQGAPSTEKQDGSYKL